MHFPCSTFCRQNKCIEINFSWKEVFCLLFYEGFMNSVAEILAIYLPLLFPCQRKLVCLAWGKWCWRWSSSSTCSTSGMSFLMAMGAEESYSFAGSAFPVAFDLLPNSSDVPALQWLTWVTLNKLGQPSLSKAPLHLFLLSFFSRVGRDSCSWRDLLKNEVA